MKVKRGQDNNFQLTDSASSLAAVSFYQRGKLSGIENNIPEKYSTFKLYCGQIVKGYYTALWEKQLDIHKDGKLRTYVAFKTISASLVLKIICQ
ncbi:Hypothetical predicted protein [Mytilus galloprovincialis]|uniref:Uncharacterized protein n=1 Tax=Mytilus galloprovincialis TaxID=29158 RepID=A0A8B6GPW1_MYTGA|nr:Hypothetical predicted protein [Mytilus galloprovincialis]